MLKLPRIRRAVAAAAAIAALSSTGLALATPAQASGTSTSGASVYSDQWKNGYRGYVSGGVVLICWADGAWSNGTNRWFAVYYGAGSGFINANLVSGQYTVGAC